MEESRHVGGQVIVRQMGVFSLSSPLLTPERIAKRASSHSPPPPLSVSNMDME